MNLYLLVLSFLLSTQSWANGPRDIVIKSRLDQQSSASFIKRIRSVLINNNVGDPYNQIFTTPIVVDFNKVIEDLPSDTQSWIKDWQELFNLKIFESSYKLKIENFSYSIEQLSSEVKPSGSDQSRIDYVTYNAVKGLKLSASNIIFQVELNSTRSGEPIRFEFNLVDPEFLISPDLMFELPMGWQTSIMPDSLLISLNAIDLSRVFEKVVKSPKLIDLSIKNITMPQVSMRVGSRELKFDQQKIKKFMLSRKDDMKMAILDLLRAKLQERFSNIIKDRPQEIYIPRAFAIKGQIITVLDLKEMSADINTRIMEGRFGGHFCSTENELQDDFCRGSQVQAKERRKIEVAAFDQSMMDIDLLFNQKRANVALSVSEHYLNQLISAAAKAGVLELGSKDFTLGPENAFVLAEEKGEGFNLYLDIIYKLTGAQRVLVGRSELRFPVRLSIGLKMVLVDKIPHLKIRVLKVHTDESLLLKGLPPYGLISNVNTARFQQKVLKGILEEIAPFDQKILLDLEIEELMDTYLEELDFFSDGKGRASAILFMNGEKRLR